MGVTGKTITPLTISKVVNNDNYNHMCVVLYAYKFEIFLNGEIVGEGTSGEGEQDIRTCNIAHDSYGYDSCVINQDNGFYGQIIDMRMYKRKLENEEITALAKGYIVPPDWSFKTFFSTFAETKFLKKTFDNFK